MHDIATVSRGVEVGGPLDLVISRTGKATLAWTAAPGGFGFYRPHIMGVADVPPAPGDSQVPPDPPDAQDPLDAQVNAAIAPMGADWPGGHLGIDGADEQTLLWHQDLLTPPRPQHPVFTEFYDVVMSDRAPGGGWSTSPSLVTGYVWNAQLAVNASGAAVVAWHQYIGPHSHVYASYRAAAGAGWTSPQRVPDAKAVEHAGIDDAGRVLLVYVHGRPRDNDGLTVRAIRRTPAGRWGKPQLVGGQHTYQPRMALGAGGAAVVAYSHYYRDDRNGEQFISRMSPAGTWSAPVRQPDGLAVGQRAFGVDAKGRALMAWWNGTDLMSRWSRPDGRWRKPCVLAANVSKPRRSELNTQVIVNRRGDALVIWRAKGRGAQRWARYKPARHEWTKSVKVTPADSPPRAFVGVGIGDRGHTAIAWTTRNNRQIQVRRFTPAP